MADYLNEVTDADPKSRVWIRSSSMLGDWTAQATKVGRWTFDHTATRGARGEDTLYRAKDGSFFLHLREVVAGKSKDRLIPMTADQAFSWTANNDYEHFDHEAFRDQETGDAFEAFCAATAGKVRIRMPLHLKEQIEQAARVAGMSVDDLVIQALHKMLTRCG